MKRDYPVLAQRQANLLQEIHELGLMTDLSLAAAVVGAGESPIDRSNFVRWRKGEACAPLGLLPVILDHAGDKAQRVLEVLAGPLGLRVTQEGDISTDDRGLLDRVLELGPVLGGVQTVARVAMADGALDMDERAQMHEEIETLIRLLRELSALVDPEASEDSKPVRVLPGERSSA